MTSKPDNWQPTADSRKALAVEILVDSVEFIISALARDFSWIRILSKSDYPSTACIEVGHSADCVALVTLSMPERLGPTDPLLANQQMVICQIIEPDLVSLNNPSEAILLNLQAYSLPLNRDFLLNVRLLNRQILRDLDESAYTGRSLKGVSLVIREHLLFEKLNMLTALEELGLSPSESFFVPKPDRTAYRSVVMACLRAKGYTILPNVEQEALSTLIERLKTIGTRKLLVVDDGGDLILGIYRNVFRSGIVVKYIETTTKGISLLKETENAPAFIDLSGTVIKSETSCAIAASCVMRFRQILQREALCGHYVHVVGFGRIGSHIAKQLRSLGCLVTVSELELSKRSAAENEGFPTFLGVTEALKAVAHRYVFGASGRKSILPSDIELLLRPAIIATASSQDARLLYEEDWADRSRIIDNVGTEFFVNGMKVATVLGEGNALNLYYSEGVSEPEFDQFVSLIFRTIIAEAGGLIEMSANEVDKCYVYNPEAELHALQSTR